MEKWKVRNPAILTLCLLVFMTTGIQINLNGQDNSIPPDTLQKITLEAVVVTANRFENKIMNTGSTIDLMGKKEMETLPVTTFSNTLKYLPGVYMASTDGMGMNPQISIRGFYGGGEAEYLTVIVDGMPVNDVTNGLVSWNLVPLNQIKRVELLRGGSSALYGDAAMGGVMNIITEKADKPYTNATLNYGNYNSYGIGVNHGGKIGKTRYEIFANNDHTDGFRMHSKWNSVAFGGKIKFPLGNSSSLTLNTSNQLLKSEDPGPMSEFELSEDREQSLPYFRDDGLDEARYLASAEFKSKINSTTDIGVGLTYRHSKKDDTRTYTQSTPIVDPFTFQPIGVYDTTLYGDTKLRNLTTNQAGLHLRIFNFNEDIGLKIVGGIEANYNNFESKYYDVFDGFQYDYQNNYLPVDTLGTYGDGYRFNTAVYASGEIRLLDPLKLVVGLRYDLIVDDFNSKIPDTSYSENNSAFSPKIALNINTGETENYSGSIYLSYSHSFKAPTIDQRTDLKRLNYAIFFPAGPAYQMVIYQANPFANPGLKPQKSNNFEIGTYQYFKLSPNLSGEINLAGYYIKVKDEIDFDLSTLQYGNIQDSEHTGLETGIRLMYKNALSGFININYNEVKFLSGEFEGNYLKGIPKTSYVIGASYTPEKGLGGALTLNGAGSLFLNDENTETLNSYSILSAKVNYKFSFVNIYVDIENIFNNKYSTTGYFLNNQKYLYPAVGTMFRGGLNFSF